MVSRDTWQEITNVLNATPNMKNRPLKRALKRGLITQACPSCEHKMSVYAAADSSYDIYSVYYGEYVCEGCARKIKLVSSFVNEPPGWKWEQTEPPGF